MQPQVALTLVRKWALPVIAMTVLGALIGFGVSKATTPVYQAKGEVLVVAGLGQNAGGTPTDLNINAAEATTTAATLITTPALLQSVIATNHLDEPEGTLAGSVTAAPQTNSELVDVTVSDGSASRAAQVANAIMTAFVAQVNKQNVDRINQASAALQSQINQVQAQLELDEQKLAATPKGQDTTSLAQTISTETTFLSQLTLSYSTFRAEQQQNLETVSVAAEAATPTVAASPRTSLNTAIGAVVGLVVGLGGATVLEFVDQGLKTPEDVRRRLGVPCLGVVPRLRGGRGLRAKHPREASGATEAYRRLRTNLLFASPDVELTSVVMTSARAGEGKTQTAANLAIALAGTDQRVLLVDADMRRPDLHRRFEQRLEGGVSEMIVALQRERGPVQAGAHATSYPNLSLVTAGMIPPNPSELLSSKRAVQLLHSLEHSFDITVIDTPPIDAVPDALSVAAEASGTIVVIEAGKTNAVQAAGVIEALRGVNANVLGVVLNKARDRRPDYYYEYAVDPQQQSAAPEVVPPPAVNPSPREATS